MIGIGTAAGRSVSVTHVQIVALYDPKTGAIRHLHSVTTLGGAVPASEQSAVAEAKHHASRRLPNSHRLAVATSTDAVHAQLSHRIDPKTKKFIPLEPKSTRRKRR